MSEPVMEDGGNGVVSGVSRGDTAALEAFVRESYGMVWRAVFRFTRDRDAAESLAQEAFLRAIGGLSRFRGECRLSTWIVRIALNLALNERRRRRPDPLPEGDLRSGALPPDLEAERNEARDRVREAIAALPEDYSRALLLTFFGGVSHAEAAAVLGCAEGTVSWRVHEAKKKLREALPNVL